jgi:cyclopropane-fatty-acyl-phospholipid synthase
MNRLVRLALQKFVRAGNLQIRTARGTTYTLGDGTGEPVALHFTTAAAERGVMLDPELRLGETYMDGTLIVEQGSIAEVLAVLQSPTVAPPV